MGTSNETNLIHRARQGDARAMDELLARNEKAVYRFGLRMCRSEDAAKEVLQQTLITAFKSLHDFRGQARLSTWLYQIARSFCGKVHRRRVDEPARFESIESQAALRIVADSNPEMAVQAREVGEAIRAAMLALPPVYREVLILRDVEGLRAEQASAVLGIELANFKTRLHRARVQLRRHLATLLEPDAPRG